MALGGGLQSSLPAHGVPDEEIEEATTSANEVLEELPNESANVVVVKEDGRRMSLGEAARQGELNETADASELLNVGQIGGSTDASSSQTTLTGEPSNIKANGSKENVGSAGSVHDVERQLAEVDNALQDGLEARLDFSKLDLVTRQAFLLKCTKALLTFGAPSHRIEADMDFAASILCVPAQFVHTPNAVVVNFGMAGSHLSESVFVKHATGGLDLGNLHEINVTWTQLENGTLTVKEAAQKLEEMMEQNPCYTTWQRVIISMFLSGLICPLGFNGGFADAMLAALFAGVLTFLRLYLAASNQRFGDIFEIVVAAGISFVAKGLSRVGHIFCYESSLSSGLVTILPGFIILSGSLELAGKNFVGGATRLVYAIIYSLFLGFAIGVGSDLYGVLDRSSRYSLDNDSDSVTFTGTITNGTSPFFSGSFSVTNGTQSNSYTNSINSGQVYCIRADTDGWYARPLVNKWYYFILVPSFAFFLALANLQPIKRKEMLATVAIACSGWVTNYFAGQYIHNRSDIVSSIGALTVGVLSNLYARISRSSSFVVAIVGVLYLVPSGVAAAGGLVISGRGQSSDGSVYQHSLGIGLLMVEVALGITGGLFFSSFLAHIFHSKRSKLNDHLRAFSF